VKLINLRNNDEIAAVCAVIKDEEEEGSTENGENLTDTETTDNSNTTEE